MEEQESVSSWPDREASHPLPHTHIPSAKTRQQVAVLIAEGVKQKVVAQVIGISELTLRKHYKEEIAEASDLAASRVVETMYNMATSGAFPQATMFYLKCRRGWTEKHNININHSGGVVDMSKLSDSALDEILKQLGNGDSPDGSEEGDENAEDAPDNPEEGVS